MWEVGLFLLLAAVGHQAIEPPGAGLDPEAEAAAWDARADLHASHDELEPAADAYSRAVEIRRSFGTKTLALAGAEHGLTLALFRQGRLDLAAEHGRRALAIRERLAPESLEVAESLDLLCNVARRQSRLGEAEAHCRQALGIAERLAPRGPRVATCLMSLAEIFRLRGELKAAESSLQRALTIAETTAPGSRIQAGALLQAGKLALARGDLAAAAAHADRAEVIWQKLAPEGLDAAATAIVSGGVARRRGELDQAESHFGRALATFEKLAPESLDVALAFMNLGNVAAHRSDLELAQSRFRRAMEIQQRLAPKGLEFAAALSNLAEVVSQRGDQVLAESYFRTVLEIEEAAAPNSLAVAQTLGDLADQAVQIGRPEQAQQYIDRALALLEELAPESLLFSATLNTAGRIALTRGDLDSAQRYFERDLSVSRRVAPGSIDVAISFYVVAFVASQRGDRVSAEKNGRQALEIQEKLAPGSLILGDMLCLLGLVSRQGGRIDEAIQYYDRALTVFERQLGQFGGPQETQADFHARIQVYYQELIELLAKKGDAERAFHVLERSRARSLLALMAERDLAVSEDVPAGLRQARERLEAEYDRIQASLADLDAHRDATEIGRLQTELRKLRERSSEIAAEIRRTSPRLAALHYPEPLDLRGVGEALDPGTVLLSYSVGGEKTHLFIVASGGPFQLAEIPHGKGALRREVELFRGLIAEARGDSRMGRSRLQALKEAARRLYLTLLGPAADRIALGERILILPDGPLHALPWGALVRPVPNGGRGGREEYLAEWKPFHVALSATVYADLRRSRSSGGGAARPALVAFGDPRFPRLPDRENLQSIADERVRSLAERGFAFDPLPASRAEVEALARLYGAEATAYLGEDATEDRAKAAAGSAHILHFATHATLDPSFPLNSALVFTLPERFMEGRDNGLLQAWEIFERVRLDADLVVLSACDSGLGRELGGEGLLGLTRAFHYAGARSVAASLWKVSDRTTGELMVRFHRHLRGGKSKDEALRAAQIELLRGPIRVRDEQGRETEIDASSPYYWAAFQIFGDWR